MTQLQKAQLQEVSADASQTPIGAAVPVQFNPSSLRLKLSNQSDGGRSRGRQRRQNNGQSSTVLSMDLIFDTADEGTPEAPVSVRTKTREVERFVLPKQDGGETPPRLQFQWDRLIIAGIVENLDIEFDHFAENGAPLRARVSLSIKEQEPKYTYLQSGRGSKGAANASNPGGSSAARPGSGTNEPQSAASTSEKSAQALNDETAAQFLARQGLDPAAWRGLGANLSGGLGLSAGADIGFSAGLGINAGVGVAAGVQGSNALALPAALSLPAALGGSDASGKKINGDDAGLALSAAGGVQSAIAGMKMQQAGQAATATQAAFASTRGNAGSATTPAGAKSSSTSSATDLTHDQSGSVALDTRAASYGFGVPLRPLYATALTQGTVTLCTHDNTRARSDGGPSFAKQKATPPWVELPARTQSRTTADGVETRKRRSPCDYHSHPCNCHRG